MRRDVTPIPWLRVVAAIIAGLLIAAAMAAAMWGLFYWVAGD